MVWFYGHPSGNGNPQNRIERTPYKNRLMTISMSETNHCFEFTPQRIVGMVMIWPHYIYIKGSKSFVMIPELANNGFEENETPGRRSKAFWLTWDVIFGCRIQPLGFTPSDTHLEG